MKPPRPKLSIILLLGTLSAFGPLSLDMYLPGLPVIQHSLNTSASLVQLSISTCLIGLAVGQLFVGPISDHIGRKPPLLVGLVLFTLTSLALGWIDNIWWFLSIRFIQGLAGSAGQVLSRAIAKDMFTGKQLTKFYATLMAINGIFPVIAPIAGAAVLAIAPWQAIFMLLAVIGALLIVGSLFVLPETKVAMSSQNLAQRHPSIFKSRSFWQPTVVLSFASGVLFSYIAGSSFIFQQVFHFSTQTFSLLYAVNGLGIALMSSLAGRLINYFTNTIILRGALLIPLISITMLVINSLTINSTWLFVGGIFIVIATFGVTSTIATAQAMQTSATNAGLASAIIGLSSNAVGSISSPIVGLFGTVSALPMIIVIGVFQLLGVVSFYLLKPKKEL
ncbi:multidrug effflux MFS transporter [Paucilactobacillus wasatchensis]|uniref:Bcr/CflA family efflux transporter n=1 Tax=Paucilactobacillus wasatchensis TaxID=1335616 RepID=A0A0D0Y5A0_9LACO|nr:multidrug effflux MFS transporter [Paucilactobacillus wasatchensis]KIS03468.1 Multidrug resistance transporter, Bcr/CflA family [Paucilactobacillus wasatchensis]